MKNATIRDVAVRAGVSKSTVSAVLNNKEVVKESTRRLVMRAMEDLNYRPNPSARRGFRSHVDRSVAVLIKELGNPFYAEMLAGIQEVANGKGYLVSVSSSEGGHQLERRLVGQLAAQDTAGLIIGPLLSEEGDLSHIYELKRSNVPFVLLEAVNGIGANLVEVDNVKASCRAVAHLIEQGHARIVHFGGPCYSQHSRERIEGVRRAFSASRLVFSDTMIIAAGHSMEEGYASARKLFGESGADRQPTAVTCYNDLLAIGVLRALRELRIRVPEDVSVIGFDDLKILEHLSPALSTVRVPKLEMGRRAAEMLVRQVESGTEQPVERVFLEAELILRESTAPPY